MRRALPAAVAPTLVFFARDEADRRADALDTAADQVDPAAAAVMRNEADAIRQNGSDATVSAAGSPVQDAMANAGNAAAASSAPPGATQATARPDSQAKPHETGDRVLAAATG